MTFTEKWKAGENAVGVWLAQTVTGGIIKSAAAPVLLWVGQSVGDWSLPPWALVAIVGAVPPLANALNPADGRYGIKPEEKPDVPQ